MHVVSPSCWLGTRCDGRNLGSQLERAGKPLTGDGRAAAQDPRREAPHGADPWPWPPVCRLWRGRGPVAVAITVDQGFLSRHSSLHVDII